MENEAIEILDVESASTKQDILNFRTLILEHFRRILNLGSKEMRGGFSEERVKTTEQGSFVEKYYVEDSRESYIAAIDNLGIALYPHYDDLMSKSEKDIENLLDLLSDKYFVDNEWIDEQSEEFYFAERLRLKQTLLKHLMAFMKRKRYFDQSHLES